MDGVDLLHEEFPGRRRLRERIEDGLGGRGKLRILGVLAENSSELFTRYLLERRTGLRSHALKPDLHALMRVGWVTEYEYRPVKYGLNLSNPEVGVVVGFLRQIGYV